MAIVEYFKKYLRTLSVAGAFSFSNCVAYDENPLPEKPWYTFMCQDFQERLVFYKKADPSSLETLVKRCEEECPNAAEGESLRFCADIYCCQRFLFQGCSYTGEKPDRFSDESGYYGVCMLHYDIEPLRTPQ